MLFPRPIEINGIYSKHNFPLKKSFKCAYVLEWTFYQWAIKNHSREGCTQKTQEKKGLTSGPHLPTVNNQGKIFFFFLAIQNVTTGWRSFYKNNEILAPSDAEHILHCLYSPNSVSVVHRCFPPPLKTGNMPCLKHNNDCVVTSDRKTCRGSFTNSFSGPLDLDTHCQKCSGNEGGAVS